MAQYFKVLSQSDKEELRKFYPNINDEVQYLIAPEEQPQTFQGQQILVAGEQLMLVDGQPQTIVVDQQQVAYQQPSPQPQFIVQETNAEQQNSQVYFMPDNMQQENNSSQSETACETPIVLNHQMQPGQLRGQIVGQKVAAQHLAQPRTTAGIAQVRQQLQPQLVHRQVQMIAQQTPRQQLLQQRPIQHVQPQKTIPAAVVQQPQQQQASPGTVLVTRTVPHENRTVPNLHYTQPSVKSDEVITEEDNQTAVALEDGTIITVAQYKQMIADQQNSEINESSATSGSTPKRKCNKSPGGRAKTPRSNTKVGTQSGGARGRTKVAQNAAAAAATPLFNIEPQQSEISTQERLLNHQRLLNQQRQRQLLQQQQQNPFQLRAQQQQQHVRLLQQQQQASQQLQQQQQQQPQYIIHPHVTQQAQQQRQCALPSYVPSSQIQEIIANTPISEEYSNSIRMLVLLPNGEQRLITFTLPKEACTIQEILEQVGVPFKSDTNISVTEYTKCGLNYVVTVGCPELLHREVNEEPGQQIVEQIQPPPEPEQQPQQQQLQPEENSNESASEQIKEQPKYIPGKLAVCMHCGYLSEDFNKCLRCKRKLPEDVKSVSVTTTNSKVIDSIRHPEKKNLQKVDNSPPIKPTNGTTNITLRKKAKPKIVDTEPVILTLSSDDEEEEHTKKTPSTEQLVQKLAESSVTLSAIRKEPSINDIQQNNVVDTSVADLKDNAPEIVMDMECRTIRIGSYRFVPPETIKIHNSYIILKVPHPRNPRDIKTIIVERTNMVKVLVSFNKIMQVIFYYVKPSMGQKIREILGMTEGSEPYFDPLSTQETCRRITVLPETLFDNVKGLFKQIYGKPHNIMDELNAKEANDILMMTCPKEVTRLITSGSFTDVKQLLIYPPGKGGLPINTEDYLCLAQDQFLNDVIIDFYLKYLVLNMPEERQEKVHVFSTFFYKRLTTKPLKASRKSHPSEMDPALTAAQKRHARVKNWTKNVNLFEKDYIIIPINEHCHWFLAIICFPNLNGTFTIDGQPIKLEPKQSKKKPVATVGNVTITTVKVEKDEKPISCEDPELSDKDEAEGDDSELEEESEEPPILPTVEEKQEKQAIKQPCILIFDSLAGSSRSRVVATLRDYLTCEYKAKMGTEKVFTKDVIKGACPKVPQQTNFTDCGLYLLQYVEEFFNNPIKDYRMPISELKTWFDESIVTKKREDISLLIKNLMESYSIDTSVLPELLLPTLNGKVVDNFATEEEEEMPEEEEEEEEEEHSEFSTSFEASITEDVSDAANAVTAVNIVQESTPSGDVIVEQSVQSALKPDLSEIRKENNRDTMSYLKAKRINRHKNSEATDAKKFKPAD